MAVVDKLAKTLPRIPELKSAQLEDVAGRDMLAILDCLLPQGCESAT